MAETSSTPRIVDLVEAKGSEPWFSLEFFPPKTDVGVNNLKKRLERLKKKAPLFVDFTWGAGGSTSDLTLDLTKEAQERGFVANMHLTCTNMPREKLDHALEECKTAGITNILALRGDPPVGQKDFKPVDSGFSCALDLVKYIRSTTGNDICVTVAGYPEGHPDRIRPVLAGQSLTPDERGRAMTAEDGTLHVCSDAEFQEELAYLKAKVDAGAQMVITQLFYDAEVFLAFVRHCRKAGITVPIVPGNMLITSYGGFMRMCGFCKTRVPPAMAKALEAIKDDADKVQLYAIQWAVDTCTKILKSGVNGLHFYTLNMDKVLIPVLEGLNLVPSAQE